MKKILVPIDFNSSKNLLFFAQELAKSLGASLEVVHVYDDALDKGTPSTVRESALRNRLVDFINEHTPSEESAVLLQREVKINLRSGSTVKQIIKAAKTSVADFIIMGNKSIHDPFEKLIGSVSSGVAQHAPCPVMIIPSEARFRGFRNILYGLNVESINRRTVQQAVDFGNLFRAEMHFIHIQQEEAAKGFIEIEEQLLQQLFSKGNPSFAINMDNLKDDSIQEGLEAYARKNRIDLIVLVNRQRSFADSVRGESLTKEMVSQAHIPLLVYHLPTAAAS